MRGAVRKAGAFDRIVAAFLTMAIACYWVPATAAAVSQPQLAEIHGNILAADGLTAVAGVSVKAANMDTRAVYTSTTTGQDGHYTLKGIPAGSYDLAVETPQGLYAANLLVDVDAGRRTAVSLALQPGVQQPPPPTPPAEGQDKDKPKADEGKKDEGKKDEGKKDDKAKQPEPQEQKKKKKGGGFWRSPGGAAILIVGGAAVLGVAANAAAGNDNEEPMTPH